MVDWISDAIAALGLVGGGIGFFMARSARKSAAASAIASAAAQADATLALERSATAAEGLTDMWERVLTPSKPAPRFEVRIDGAGDVGHLRNVGTAKAFGLTIHGYPAHLVNMVSSGEPQDVPPRGIVNFAVEHSFGEVQQVEVAWQPEDGSEIFREQFWITT